MIAVGLKVLAGTLFWEAQFQVFQWLFSAMPAKTPHERLFKKCAPSYIVSYVHAFFLAWAGWRIVLTLEGALDVETLHARLRRRMRHSMHVLMQERNPDSYYSEVVHLEPT